MRMPSLERQDQMMEMAEKLGYDPTAVLNHETVIAYGRDRRTGVPEQVFLRIVDDKVHIYTWDQTVDAP